MMIFPDTEKLSFKAFLAIYFYKEISRVKVK
jgi:hypothetical protein